MTEDKQALMALGRIEGRMEEQARHSRDLVERMQRLEDAVNQRLSGHDQRINQIELAQARATRQSALTGAGAAGFVTGAVYVIKALFGKV